MTAAEKFYALEAFIWILWLVVAWGLLFLTVVDWLERHDEDRRFYRKHWRIILVTFTALFVNVYLEHVLRGMEYAIWHR